MEAKNYFNQVLTTFASRECKEVSFSNATKLEKLEYYEKEYCMANKLPITISEETEKPFDELNQKEQTKVLCKLIRTNPNLAAKVATDRTTLVNTTITIEYEKASLKSKIDYFSSRVKTPDKLNTNSICKDNIREFISYIQSLNEEQISAIYSAKETAK